MGQGFHSKVIYGIVLSLDESQRYENLYQTDAALSDRISDYMGKIGVSSSYQVIPVWFGSIFAATDNLVARMNKVADIESGIKVSEIAALAAAADLAKAQKAMKKATAYLRKNGFSVGESDLYVVSDFH